MAAPKAKPRTRKSKAKENGDTPVILPAADHARGCKGRKNPDSVRTEVSEAVRPPSPQAGRPYARLYKITRCIECGGQVKKKLRDLVPLDPDEFDDEDDDALDES